MRHRSQLSDPRTQQQTGEVTVRTTGITTCRLPRQPSTRAAMSEAPSFSLCVSSGIANARPVENLSRYRSIHAETNRAVCSAQGRGSQAVAPALTSKIQSAVDESVAEPAACWGKARPLQPPAQPYAREYHKKTENPRGSARQTPANLGVKFNPNLGAANHFLLPCASRVTQ